MQSLNSWSEAKARSPQLPLTSHQPLGHHSNYSLPTPLQPSTSSHHQGPREDSFVAIHRKSLKCNVHRLSGKGFLCHLSFLCTEQAHNILWLPVEMIPIFLPDSSKCPVPWSCPSRTASQQSADQRLESRQWERFHWGEGFQEPWANPPGSLCPAAFLPSPRTQSSFPHGQGLWAGQPVSATPHLSAKENSANLEKQERGGRTPSSQHWATQPWNSGWGYRFWNQADSDWNESFASDCVIFGKRLSHSLSLVFKTGVTMSTSSDSCKD